MKKAALPINGADTETHHGYARLLCIENAEPFFTRETGEWVKWGNHLLNTYPRIAFYNLRFDVEAILKHFPEEFIKNLLYLNEAEIKFNDHKSWSFRLIPWKVLTIKEIELTRDGRRRSTRGVEIFEAAQFFQTSLNNASKEVLGEEKIEDKDFAASLNVSEILWDTQLDRIIEYCQDDATKAGRLIRTFIESAASKPIDLAPRNPISCAWYAKELFKQCIPETKSIKSIRKGGQRFYSRPWNRWDNVGTQCYGGGRFETPMKGTFHEAFNADINSAYPYWIAQLPNPFNLSFVKDFEPEGQWSMVKATVWVPRDLNICPLPFRLPDSLIYPNGQWTGWFHWDQLKNSMKYGVAVDIHKTLNGFEPEGKQRPFAKRIPELYEARKKWKEMNDPRQLSSKVAMNSGYGILYEKAERLEQTEEGTTEIDGHFLAKHKDNPGRYFHPYLAGWITSKTQTQLYSAAMQQPDHIAFLATDGILSTKRLNLPYNKDLGGWSLKHTETINAPASYLESKREHNVEYAAARVFGNGLYEFGGKLKTRGFRKDGMKDKRPLKDRMRIATILDKKLGANPGDILIQSIEYGPIHLGMSFKLRDYSLKDALTWIEKRKETNITQCKKRIWPKYNMSDLYEKQITSKPKTIDGNPLNVNSGLAWTGASGSNPDFTDRRLLGAIQVASNP